MKAEEVRKSSAGLLVEEAKKYPGASGLVADVELAGESFEAQPCMERMGLFGMALARLEGWLMRHLAEPEKGESERLLEALVDLDGSLGPGSRGWSVYPPYGEECGISEGEGATPLEALRAAFPEASVSPAPVVPAPAAEEQDQEDDDQDGGGAHG